MLGRRARLRQRALERLAEEQKRREALLAEEELRKAEKKLIEKRNNLDSMLYQAEKTLSENEEAIPDEDKQAVRDAARQTTHALHLLTLQQGLLKLMLLASSK